MYYILYSYKKVKRNKKMLLKVIGTKLHLEYCSVKISTFKLTAIRGPTTFLGLSPIPPFSFISIIHTNTKMTTYAFHLSKKEMHFSVFFPKESSVYVCIHISRGY